MKEENQSSIIFRYGGTATEVKLYFKDATDLEQKTTELNKKMSIITKNITSIKEQARHILDAKD